MTKYIGVAISYPLTTIPNINIYHDMRHTYIDCITLQCSAAVEEEEESSHPCVECELLRELLLHTQQLMPPLDIGFERFEENELDNATISKHEPQQQQLQ